MGAPYSPSVVVGIDGSRAAGNAALWAVDEAVSRDIPLRLVYAIDSTDNSDNVTQGAARNLAAAGRDLGGAGPLPRRDDPPARRRDVFQAGLGPGRSR